MTALVETHSADEVERALDLGASVVGVNARDLSTFELDRDLFGTLADRIPSGVIRIAESAVLEPADVAHYRAAGADVVLVGEALVTGDDPVATLEEFLAAGIDDARCATQPGPFFGEFGGRFMPESLIAAIDELAAAYEAAKIDPAFQAELAELHRTYTGRPSIITEVPRFAEHAGGARIILKREDLNHTGSHKINNVLGQALLTRRIGKKRRHRRDRCRPARRRHGDRRRAVRPGVHHLHGRGRHRSARRSTSPACACSAPRSSR